MTLERVRARLMESRQAFTQLTPLLGLTALVALVVGGVLLTQAWRPAPAAPPWAPIFIERFDDPSVLKRAAHSSPDLGHERAERAWWVQEGRLWGEGGHNAALWLNELTLPERARIELKARAETKTGDLKCELYGDGETHQSGMIIINGGWHNKLRVIARRDEHGEDRKEDRSCRPHCAPKGQEQQWVIERDGGLITWYIDGRLALQWVESAPLTGRRFAFNHWSAKVSYDDLVVYDLSGPHLP